LQPGSTSRLGSNDSRHLAKGFKYYFKKLMKEEMLGAIDVKMFEFHSKW
jgi:hypothetical protein